MNDPLIGILYIEQANARFLGGTSGCDDEIFTTGHECFVTTPGKRVNNVVHCTKGVLSLPHLTTALE